MVSKHLLTEPARLSDKSSVLLKALRLLVVRGEEHGAGAALDVSPQAHDGVDVASLLPVLGVVVAELGAEAVHDGVELGKSDLLAFHDHAGLGKATAKFAAVASGLLSFPNGRGQAVLLVGLAVVVQHENDRVGATLCEVEVVDRDVSRNARLSVRTHLLFLARLRVGSRRVAAHCLLFICLIMIKPVGYSPWSKTPTSFK